MADLQATMGHIIRRARRACRLTLRELAARSALSVVYLGEIERGKKYPSARVLEELARALDMDISDLLDLVAQELRITQPPMLTQPVGSIQAPSKDPTPRASLASHMAVFTPTEVTMIALMGTFNANYGTADVAYDSIQAISPLLPLLLVTA